MPKIANISNIFTLVLTLAFVAACADSGLKSQLTFSDGRLIVHNSEKDVAENIVELGKVSEKYLPEGTEGGIIFDAKIIRRVDDDKLGQHVWILRPTKIYLGAPTTTLGEMKVVTPLIENGGVELAVGMNYRIFSINMNGRFFIWNGTVLKL